MMPPRSKDPVDVNKICDKIGHDKSNGIGLHGIACPVGVTYLINWQLEDFYKPVVCLKGVEYFPGDNVKYQDVGKRGDPTTDGVFEKLYKVVGLNTEQLMHDIHGIVTGCAIYERPVTQFLRRRRILRF